MPHDPDAPIPFDTEIVDDLDDLSTCDSCGAEMSALSDYCAKCGHWQVEGEAAGKIDLRRPHRNTKLIAGVLLLLFGLSILITLYQLLT